MERIRQGYQKTATELLEETVRYDAVAWTRHKLRRWGLHMRRLQNQGRAVAPRVLALVIGCAWNRWTTARRFQRRS